MWPSVSVIIFRILNFIALIAVSAYFFKRYAYPPIRENQNKKKKALIDFEAEKEALAAKQAAIDAHVREQEAVRGVLLERLKAWRDAFEHEKQVLAHEQNQRREQLNGLMRMREQYAHQEQIKRAAIPTAVAQAREKLSEQFGDPEHGKQYLANLTTMLEKQ